MLNNVAFLPSFQFRAYLTTTSLWIILSLNAVAVYIFLVIGMDFNQFRVYFKILQANLQTALPTNSRTNQGRKRKSDSLNTLKI